jgi:hypothetical protein
MSSACFWKCTLIRVDLGSSRAALAQRDYTAADVLQRLPPGTGGAGLNAFARFFARRIGRLPLRDTRSIQRTLLARHWF